MTTPRQGPLNYRVPIVNPSTGTPTAEFMQKWQKQAQINESIDFTTAAQVSSILDLIGGDPGDILIRGTELWQNLPTTGDPSQYLTGNGGYATPVITDLTGYPADPAQVLLGDGTFGPPPGAGGGTPWWLNVPTVASLTLMSGDATNLVVADDADVGITVVGGAPASGTHMRVALQAIPVKTADFVITLRAEQIMPTNNYSGGGVVLRDSISGRVVSLTMRGNRGVVVINFNSLSSYSGDAGSTELAYDCKWFRVVHASGQYRYQLSPDGKVWVTVLTTTDTAFLTNRANQFGFVIDYDRAAGLPNTMSVGHLTLV